MWGINMCHLNFIMERYEWLEKNPVMGEGTYGVVYKAIDLQSDTIVAMKVGESKHAIGIFNR